MLPLPPKTSEKRGEITLKNIEKDTYSDTKKEKFSESIAITQFYGLVRIPLSPHRFYYKKPADILDVSGFFRFRRFPKAYI